MQLLYPFLRVIMNFREGSNERDSSSPTERVSPVILSEAKDLSAERDRPFASLRVTRWDGCNCEGLFFTTEPCLRTKYNWIQIYFDFKKEWLHLSQQEDERRSHG